MNFKLCKKCNIKKDISCFYKGRSICKFCLSKIYKEWSKNPEIRKRLNLKQREWRKKNFEHYKEYERKRAIRRRKELEKELLENGMIKIKCVRCNYNKCIVALEYHHKEKGEKDFSISQALVQHKSIDKIKKEISKCVILCANCHRELHSGIWEL